MTGMQGDKYIQYPDGRWDGVGVRIKISPDIKLEVDTFFH